MDGAIETGASALRDALEADMVNLSLVITGIAIFGFVAMILVFWRLMMKTLNANGDLLRHIGEQTVAFKDSTVTLTQLVNEARDSRDEQRHLIEDDAKARKILIDDTVAKTQKAHFERIDTSADATQGVVKDVGTQIINEIKPIVTILGNIESSFAAALDGVKQKLTTMEMSILEAMANEADKRDFDGDGVVGADGHAGNGASGNKYAESGGSGAGAIIIPPGGD